MKSKILLISVLIFSMVTPTFAFEEIECSSDPIFAANSCNQCFNGLQQGEGETVGFLVDDWENNTATDMIVYKEIQEEPRLINLSPDLVSWTQVPSSQDFWRYTSEFDNLYSEAEDGYVLEAGKKISWIESRLGYGYEVTSNNAQLGTNIGLLVFPLITNGLLTDGTITENTTAHNECVLFTSGDTQDTTVEVKRLPETGPAQFFLLAFLAMIMSFGFIRNRKK